MVYSQGEVSAGLAYRNSIDGDYTKVRRYRMMKTEVWVISGMDK